MNPKLGYGLEAFVRRASAAGRQGQRVPPRERPHVRIVVLVAVSGGAADFLTTRTRMRMVAIALVSIVVDVAQTGPRTKNRQTGRC